MFFSNLLFPLTLIEAELFDLNATWASVLTAHTTIPFQVVFLTLACPCALVADHHSLLILCRGTLPILGARFTQFCISQSIIAQVTLLLAKFLKGKCQAMLAHLWWARTCFEVHASPAYRYTFHWYTKRPGRGSRTANQVGILRSSCLRLFANKGEKAIELKEGREGPHP